MTEAPLHSLLSQALVAFTIEFDNEAEHRMPHRTTMFGAADETVRGPWLVSMAMWFNCIRFVGEQPITVRELERLARTQTNLLGMQRWGYIKVGKEGNITATRHGRTAYETWKPLFGEIEQRWNKRFGGGTVNALSKALEAIAVQFSEGLPDCMPMVMYGQRTVDVLSKNARGVDNTVPTAALLAKVLLRFTLDFEQRSKLSLPVCANVLRILPNEGTPLRNMPQASGIAKEAIQLALRFLQKHELVTVMAPAARAPKTASLTNTGRRARDAYFRIASSLEQEWKTRYGDESVDCLRRRLEHIVSDCGSQLLQGVRPYPDNWRAQRPARLAFPHQALVTHRGGYPDGS